MYMNTAIINFTTQPQLKAKAQQVAKQLGIPLSLALNNYLKHLVKTKTVIFSEEPSKYLIKAIEEAEQNRKRGKVLSFKSKKAVISYLDSLIENEKEDKPGSD